MGLLRREPIYLTCSLIVLLAAAEGWVGWRYLREARGGDRAVKIATLERALRTKQAELDRLIVLHDLENRRTRELLAQAQPPAAPTRKAEELSPDEELIQAAANPTPVHSPSSLQSSRYPVIPGFPVPMDEEDDNDVVSAPQGAAPVALSPADIDPKNLVNMANIMTGRHVAELTRMKGQPLIRYMSTALGADDPVWHLLDAVTQAHALEGIVLVGKNKKDAALLKKVTETLVSSGIPSRLIEIRAGETEYTGLEGILITLSTISKNSTNPKTRGKP